MPAHSTLHPTPLTQRPTPYTLRPAPYTLHPTPYTQGWFSELVPRCATYGAFLAGFKRELDALVRIDRLVFRSIYSATSLFM